MAFSCNPASPLCPSVGSGQPDVPGRIGLQAPRLPVSVTGIVRAEYVPDKTVNGFSLGNRTHTPYPVADEEGSGDLPERKRCSGQAQRPCYLARHVGDSVNKTAVEIDGGCEAGKIY